MPSNPFRDETLLLLMQSELRRAFLMIAFLFRAQVGAEPPVRLGGNLPRESLVR